MKYHTLITTKVTWEEGKLRVLLCKEKDAIPSKTRARGI